MKTRWWLTALLVAVLLVSTFPVNAEMIGGGSQGGNSPCYDVGDVISDGWWWYAAGVRVRVVETYLGGCQVRADWYRDTGGGWVWFQESQFPGGCNCAQPNPAYHPVDYPLFDLNALELTSDQATLASSQELQGMDVIDLNNQQSVFHIDKLPQDEKITLALRELPASDYLVTGMVAERNLDGFFAFRKNEDGSVRELQRFNTWGLPNGLFRQVVVYQGEGRTTQLVQLDDRSIQITGGETGIERKPCSGGYTRSYTLGVDDTFAATNGVELAHPSPGLVLWFQSLGYASSVLRNYDDVPIDHWFIDTFNFPLVSDAHIVGATLTTRIRKNGGNDTFGLIFADALGNLNWSEGWGISLTNLGMSNGQTQLIQLDLANLPASGAYPTNLIPMLNSKGWLDVMLQDDSVIDFMTLTLRYECNNVLSCAPDSPTVYQGQEFYVRLKALITVPNTYGIETKVQTNPGIIQPQQGYFFAPTNSNQLFPSPGSLVGSNTANPGAGTWTGGASLQAPQAPFTPVLSKNFASLRYKAMNPGLAFLTFSNTVFSDRDGFVLPGGVTSCWVRVVAVGHLAGTVKYQGRLNHANIQISTPGTTPAALATTGVNGFFNLGPLAAGSASVRAYAPKYLPDCTPATVVGGVSTILPDARILGGNLVNSLPNGSVALDADAFADNDRVINIGDFTRLTASFGLNDPDADINADGTVNVQDLSILGGNFGRSGCQPWLP